jgi:acetolactate synthase-1/2/3 large subunit
MGKQTMRVCDWIAEYLKSIGVKRVHGLMGGGAAGLNDGFIKQSMPYICYHNEQGAGHAAIGESKYTGQLAVVNPTTGCAGTNCATSVLDAWQDGVPVMFISGNVRKDTCSGYINNTKKLNIRKYGIQEHHIVDTYRSITKMAVFVTDPKDVRYTIEQAVYEAKSGRPGPVWIDIPGDVQLAPMPDNSESFRPPAGFVYDSFQSVRDAIAAAQRPIVLAGYGIRQSGTVEYFKQFIEQYQIPFVSTYGARDYVPETHQLSIGTVGQRGSRAGNFALQNADLLLILGSSLNASVVGYDPQQFAPVAKKIMVDGDRDELNKDIVTIDEKVQVKLVEFFLGMLK